MPACRDPQHERFCRELVEQYLMVPPPKQPQLEAYKRAGYAPHRGNCYRLAKRKEIVQRVAELMEEAREYLDIRAVKALVRVDRIADAKLPDYFERVRVDDVVVGLKAGPSGLRLVTAQDAQRVKVEPQYVMRVRDITTLPPRLAEALAEVEIDPETGHVRKFKLHDKNAANLALLKYFGSLPDPEAREAEGGDVNILNVFGSLTAEDQRALAGALETLAQSRRAGTGGEGTAAAGERVGEDA
jgi:hypothetical protein